jgi:NTP pyrophosphatase (non-canonical NTP hydrolase)
MTIAELQRLAFEISESKGFHAPRPIDGVVRDASFGERIALVHEELTEALQCYRKGGDQALGHYFEVDGKPEGVVVELADAVIRICDLAETHGMDLESAIAWKCAFNRTRVHMHGSHNL